MDHLPVSTPQSSGESRTVDVDHVFKWLGRGWSSFMAEPAQWLLMTLVLIVIMLALSFIPLAGGPICTLLTPLFIAGMLCAAQHIADDEDPEFNDLFAGFSKRTGSLIALGALYLAASLLITLIVFAIVGGGVLGGALRGDMAGVGVAAGSVIVAGLLMAALSAPVCMAMWFAPALVFFEDAPPVAAMKASFNACWKNIVPFLVYGVLMFVTSIVAALPFMLGFFIFLPFLCASMLASYHDIFGRQTVSS